MKRFATIAIMLGATALLGATTPAPPAMPSVADCEPLSHSCAELQECVGGTLPSTVECVDGAP